MARSRWSGYWWPALAAGLLVLAPLDALRADETEAERLARLSKMTAEQKAELSAKQERFNVLPDAGKQRLRDLHSAVTSDPNAEQLADTIRRYNQWLANLSSGQRAAVLSIANHKDRIEKIKDLIRAQEEARFRQFVEQEVLPKDRDVIFEWLGSFVAQHESTIRKRMNDGDLRRLDEAPDAVARRRSLIVNWQRQLRDRDSDAPTPSRADYDRLLASLSEESRKQITTKPEESERRLADLVRAAAFSLYGFNPPPSREELDKFRRSIPLGDARRDRLESLEDEELHRELLTMYNRERYGRRGFGSGGRGFPGGGGRGGGQRGGPGGGLPPFGPGGEFPGPGPGGFDRPPPKGEEPRGKQDEPKGKPAEPPPA